MAGKKAFPPRAIGRRAAAVSLLVLTLVATALASPVAHVSASDAPLSPPAFAAADVKRLDLSYGDVSWLPLFQSSGAEVIARLAGLYGEASQRVVAAPQVPADLVVPPRALRLTILLTDGTWLALAAGYGKTEVRVEWKNEAGEWLSVTLDHAGLRGWFDNAPSIFPPPYSGEWLLPRRRLHPGDELRVFQPGWQEVDHVDIYLLPLGSNRQGETGPGEYPCPAAALVGTVVPRESVVEFALTLGPEVGRRPDGSPLRLLPGAYEIDLVGGALQGGFIWILPDNPASVVAVRGNRAAVWTPGGGVEVQPIEPTDVPRRSPNGMSYTLVTDRYLELAGIPVRVEGSEAGGGPNVVLGGGEAEISATPGHTQALMNGTELWFGEAGPAVTPTGFEFTFGDSEVALILECRFYHPGDDQVFMVRAGATVPPELLAALGYLPGPGDPPLVTCNGIPVDGRSVLRGGRLYVPAAALSRACGGGTMVAEGGSLYVTGPGAPVTVAPGGRILVWDETSGQDVELPDKAIIVGGRSYVPLRALALALGATVTWNERLRVAEVSYDPGQL